jgi:hypothetical protein
MPGGPRSSHRRQLVKFLWDLCFTWAVRYQRDELGRCAAAWVEGTGQTNGTEEWITWQTARCSHAAPASFLPECSRRLSRSLTPRAQVPVASFVIWSPVELEQVRNRGMDSVQCTEQGLKSKIENKSRPYCWLQLKLMICQTDPVIMRLQVYNNPKEKMSASPLEPTPLNAFCWTLQQLLQHWSVEV